MSLQEMKERVREAVSSKMFDLLESTAAELSDTEAMDLYKIFDPEYDMMKDEESRKFINAIAQLLAPLKKSNRRVINPRALNAQKKTKAETKET